MDLPQPESLQSRPSFARAMLAGLVLVAFSTDSGWAAGDCNVNRQAALPITLQGSQPILPVKVNGQETRFILDNGTFYSSVSSAMVRSLNLKVTGSRTSRFQLGNARMQRDRQLTTIKLVEFPGVQAERLDFMVADNAFGDMGIIGNDLLTDFDIEYDLARGSIVLLKTTGCLHANLAYWRDKQQSSSHMDFPYAAPRDVSGTLVNEVAPSMLIEAQMSVNGVRMLAVLDSGAFQSMLTLKGAAHAGVRPNSPGVKRAGPIEGIGSGTDESYVGTFASVKLGETEELTDVQMRFADLDRGDAEVVLGADFFLSHHVLVSRALRRIYFTRNGNAVFNVEAGEPRAARAEGSAENPAAGPQQ